MNYTDGKCYCLKSFYDTGSSILCESCHVSCNTCTNSTHCSTCTSTNYRTLNSSADYFGVLSNYCVCYYGTYPINPTTCGLCHEKCEVCHGPLETQCDFCSDTYKRKFKLSTTECVCKDGYYDDGNYMCADCDIRCLRCTGPSTEECQQCAGGYYYVPSLTSCVL